MGAWSADSKHTRSFYGKWRFYGSEISLTVTEPTDVKIEFIAKMEQLLFKESTPLKEGEIIDSSVMNLKSLKRFAKTIAEAKKLNVLLSVHLKATMMKYQIQLF
jgi:isocitrate dehydrogenase